MSYFKILGFAICGLTAIILFRRFKDEYALFISLFTGITLTAAAFSMLEPVVSYAQSFRTPDNAGLVPLIIKSAGVAIITTVASDLCRDCGEAALGNRLELCGKALILSLALPLIKNVFDSCLTLLG